MLSSFGMDSAANKTAADGTLRVLQITDPHLCSDRSKAMRGVDTFQSLSRLLEQAKTMDWPPDAILVTGDLIHDDSATAYEHFRQFFGDAGAPVYTLPGNHDDPKLMQAILDAPPFQYCGHADHGNWRLIFLDTWVSQQAGGHLSDAELERLDVLLGETKDRHALVCLHHHPIRMGSRWLDSVGLKNADAFLRIIESNANVRAVIWGHVHQESDQTRGGVRYMSSPSTGSQFLPGHDDFKLDNRPPGYRWLELAPNGGIDTGVVWIDELAVSAAGT